MFYETKAFDKRFLWLRGMSDVEVLLCFLRCCSASLEALLSVSLSSFSEQLPLSSFTCCSAPLFLCLCAGVVVSD